MENNNMYVTKKEFYSTMTGIFTFISLTLLVNVSENKASFYVLFFFVVGMLFYCSYKSIKERTRIAGMQQKKQGQPPEGEGGTSDDGREV